MWAEAVDVVTELCLEIPGTSVAILLFPEHSSAIAICGCRLHGQGRIEHQSLEAELPCGVLLNQSRLLEIAAATGLVKGMNLQLHCWYDLACALVLEVTPLFDVTQSNQILTACRRILSDAIDRPLLLPSVAVLNAMAEFSAGAAHEINNPLATIIGQAQLLGRNEAVVDRRQSLETIGAQAWRIRDMIGNAMVFARPPAANPAEFDLVEIAGNVVSSLQPAAASDSCVLQLMSQVDAIRMVADRTQMTLLMTHLIRNSMESVRPMGSQGSIRIELQTDIPGVVEITVTDNGQGLRSAADRANLFNPFYSGRSAGRGLGFGLCLAWRIVTQHKGLIFAEELSGQGLRIYTAFPAD